MFFLKTLSLILSYSHILTRCKGLVGVWGIFGLSKGGLIFGTSVVLFVIPVQCTYDLNLALMSP